MNFKDIIRDASFIFFITYCMAFIIGFFSLLEIPYLFFVTNNIAAFIGFCFVAKWNSKNRAEHLFFVSFILFLEVASRSLTVGNIEAWLKGVFQISILASLAWAALKLFEKVKNRNETAS